MHALIDTKHRTYLATHAKAKAIAEKLNADDDGSFTYSVAANAAGYWVEVLDADTGEKIGDL